MKSILTGNVPFFGIDIVKNINPKSKNSEYIGLIENHGIDLPPIIVGKSPENILYQYEKLLYGYSYKKVDHD